VSAATDTIATAANITAFSMMELHSNSDMA
jgi:hypothetical protein